MNVVGCLGDMNDKVGMYKIILREFFRLHSSSTPFLASMFDKISSLNLFFFKPLTLLEKHLHHVFTLSRVSLLFIVNARAQGNNGRSLKTSNALSHRYNPIWTSLHSLTFPRSQFFGQCFRSCIIFHHLGSHVILKLS